MKLEKGVSEILFNDIDPQWVLDRLLYQNSGTEFISFEMFYRSGINRFEKTSMNEIEKIYNSLRIDSINFDDPVTFFQYLGKFASTLLVYNEYEPKIRYEKLMRWNKIAHLLGQDILTMSHLAYHDYNYNDWTEFFGYKSIISTDNRQLHNILQQGIAENHFHLKGSTQIFCLNWLSLMNHPLNREKEFKRMNIHLNPYYKYEYQNNYNMCDFIKLAAIFRMYFFIRTNSYYKNINKVNIDDINLHKLLNDLNVDDKNTILNKYLQHIEVIKSEFNFKTNIDLDYSLKEGIDPVNGKEISPLVGERRLLYLSIRMMLARGFTSIESKCFYLYILIKNNFRRELIQVNNLYGFSNFSDYERRKEVFIDDFPKYCNALLKMAIDETFNNQNIVSLEARIVPKMKAIDNIKYIKRVDKICGKNKDKLFYVFHFVKKKDIFKEDDYVCRNHNVRKEVEYQSKCIAKCLENNFIFRDRIRGIDACNNEFFCRPEVFGQCYRYLSKFHVVKSGYERQVPIDIYKTYHVGEDFLDITDGLRAIEEAILFCNLERGSRLGHATVLGIDANEYYNKKNRIVMTKLEYIDNIVWLLKKAELMNIDMSQYPCCSELRSRCYALINEVYGDAASGCSIDDYYNSWLLRGDNPERYQTDGTMLDKVPLTRYERCDFNLLVDNNCRTRKAGKLYYAYHFSPEIKIRGQIVYDLKIVDDYVKLVRVIQKKMRFDISRKGIFIECNPTSNYLISNLERYEKHPIITFYNDELFNGKDKECAQINVSINTDDQGVFDTSLENEFALMAYALEYYCDENGFAFTPNQVYKWIDSVRKMGIQQKFK